MIRGLEVCLCFRAWEPCRYPGKLENWSSYIHTYICKWNNSIIRRGWGWGGARLGPRQIGPFAPLPSRHPWDLRIPAKGILGPVYACMYTSLGEGNAFLKPWNCLIPQHCLGFTQVLAFSAEFAGLHPCWQGFAYVSYLFPYNIVSMEANVNFMEVLPWTHHLETVFCFPKWCGVVGTKRIQSCRKCGICSHIIVKSSYPFEEAIFFNIHACVYVDYLSYAIA